MARLVLVAAALLCVGALRAPDSAEYAPPDSTVAGGVAICLVGWVPKAELSLPSFVKHVVKPLQADVFISTGNDATYVEKVREALSMIGKVNHLVRQEKKDLNITEKLLAKSMELGGWRSHEELDNRLMSADSQSLLRSDVFMRYLFARESCAIMIERAESRRKAQYKYVKIVRPDLSWVADHPRVALITNNTNGTCFTTPGMLDGDVLCRRSNGMAFLRSFTLMAAKPGLIDHAFDMTHPRRFLESALRMHNIKHEDTHTPYYLLCQKPCHFSEGLCAKSRASGACYQTKLNIEPAEYYAKVVKNCGWHTVHNFLSQDKIAAMRPRPFDLETKYFNCTKSNPLHIRHA